MPAANRAHKLGQALLGDAQDVLLVDKGHLDVELGKLQTPVGAQVLVAKAPGDLKVALDPGNHEKLLVLLRRLRQRVEATRVDPTRDDELAGATGRLFRQDGRFDLEKLAVAEPLAEETYRLVANLEIPLHRLPTQVQVAVLEAQVLVDLGRLVDRERRRPRRVQYLSGPREDLDVSRWEIRIDHALRARLDHPFNRKDVLRSRFVRDGHGGG